MLPLELGLVVAQLAFRRAGQVALRGGIVRRPARATVLVTLIIGGGLLLTPPGTFAGGSHAGRSTPGPDVLALEE